MQRGVMSDGGNFACGVLPEEAHQGDDARSAPRLAECPWRLAPGQAGLSAESVDWRRELGPPPRQERRRHGAPRHAIRGSGLAAPVFQGGRS